MIPNLLDVVRRFGVAPALLALVLAGALTGAALFAQSVASWFDDRNS